jgi:hypothetical protein
MAGLDPAIYLIEINAFMAADARIESGHDESLLVDAGIRYKTSSSNKAPLTR